MWHPLNIIAFRPCIQWKLLSFQTFHSIVPISGGVDPQLVEAVIAPLEIGHFTPAEDVPQNVKLADGCVH